MTRRANRLIVLAFVVFSLTLYYGCSQTDDIVTPVSESRLTLEARNLPNLPEGMVYELWIADDEDSVSVGQFTYDNETNTYLTVAGDPRPDGAVFVFQGDVLSYEDMFISVQNPAVDPAGSPGPIMLTDEITEPIDNPIWLDFPDRDSLWLSTLEYNLRTPSDTDRAENNGAGIWFSQYILRPESLADTLGIQGPDSFTIDTLLTDTANNDTGYTSIAGYAGAFVETVQVVFGFDSLTHIRTDFADTIYSHDSEKPYRAINVVPNWNIGPTSTFLVDLFFQQEYGLIDYSEPPYGGWKYKGWVVSPAIEEQGASLGKITPPAWDAIGQGLIPGWDGGMLTTGTFGDFKSPDDSNPYVDGPRVPPIPGEDFMENLPNGATGPISFFTKPSGNEGTVFVTLEPDNYNTDTTNFPLFVYIGSLPSDSSALELTPGQNQDLQQFFPMVGYMQTNIVSRGFPLVRVGLERE